MTAVHQRKLAARLAVVSLIVLTAGFLIYLYFRSSYSTGRVLTLSTQQMGDARLRHLEDAISRLELQNTYTGQPKPNETAEDAYKRGLKQHEDLLNEVRAELRLTQDQLRESSEAVRTARETTQRMQDAEAAFLAIFGIVAALIAGQGYLQIRGWNDRAEDALKEIEDVKPDLESIRDARESLETELPTFLDAARGFLNVEDATGPIQQEDIALIDQIDHFTYLSAPMRFRRIHSDDEARKYLEALRVAARGHVARSAPWEATSRLDEFFSLAEKFPKAVSEKNKALAYSYRSVASYQLLNIMVGEQSWVRNSKAARIMELRDQAFADVKRARECYPQQNYGDFVEALLYSARFVPEMVSGKVSPQEVILKGQRKAVQIYENLIPNATGRKQRAALQNMACCLKRIADITGDSGDYGALKKRLASYPSDKDLWQQTASAAEGRVELNFLWQGILSDGELFATIDRIDATDYKTFWESLLDQKVILRKWRDDLAELRSRSPKMRDWAVTL